ncbi:MAG: DHH family phosphoesterase [Armatimonadetes bacterium]|nr:DHH family phosphoesterase [Armatimonadota bacterium]
MDQTKIQVAAQAICTARNVLIACHVHADGDALGSLLALGLGLERLGKTVTLVSPDGVPELWRFLPHWSRVRTAADPNHADLGIGVDADGSDRLGSAEAAVLAAPVVIDIDHHAGPDLFGQIHLVEPGAAATGEIVYELLQTLRAPFDGDIATCLLTAILTDTGSFRYGSVTPRTFTIAGELVAAGASPGTIYGAVYEQRTLAAARLLGIALERLEVTAGGALAWSVLRRDDFARVGACDEQTEGIVNQLRAVRGVRVAALFREGPEGEIRVSLRARDETDVGQVARQFGGGGHRAAAGCTLSGPLAVAVEQVIAAAATQLAMP